MKITHLFILLLVLSTFSLGCSNESEVVPADEEILPEEEENEEEEELPEIDPCTSSIATEIPDSLNYSGNWQFLAPMTIGRYDAGFEIHDQKIYALGGFSSDTKSAEVFDLEMQCWSNLDPLPLGQSGITSELVDDKIYLFGSYGGSKIVQVYDIGNSSWSQASDLLHGLYWAASEHIGDTIYVFGGYDPPLGNLDVLQKYDTKSDTWVTETMPRTFTFPNSTVHEGIIYVWDDSFLYNYDPSTQEWTQETIILDGSGSRLRANQQAISYGSKVVFFGGSDSYSKFSDTYTDIQTFDPEIGTWQTLDEDFILKRHYNYGLIKDGTKIYLIGGRQANTWESLNQVEYLESLSF